MAHLSSTHPVWGQTAPSTSPLHDWLTSQGSLTRLLREQSDGQFSVRPVREGWQPLRPDECQALGCPPDTDGWVREVFLCGRQQPWIYARSVASRQVLLASGFDLASLGSRSLGELLFSDQAFSRGPFEFCSLPSAAWPQPLLDSQSCHQPLWARRSCFSRQPLDILVAEAFLPAFWQHLDTPHPDRTPA